MATILKASEKKERTTKAIDDLRGILTPGTIINMDNRGDNLSGTGRKYKALIVRDGEMKNISNDMAHALCLRPGKDGLTFNVAGSVDSGVDLAASTVEMLSRLLFNDTTSLVCKAI